MEIYREIIPLKTYTVDKKLLQSVEKYINNKIPSLLNLNIHSNNEKGSLLSYGALTIHYASRETHTFKTIDDYPHDVFLDKTKGVTIEIAYRDEIKKAPIFVIAINLQKKKKLNDLVIGIYDECSDIKATAIKKGLLDVMSQKRNLNHLLYPNDIFSSFLMVIALLTALLIFIVNNETIRLYLIILLALNVLYLFGLRLFKGYCCFESNYQKRLDIIFKWLMGGIAAFILVSTLTSVRRLILGF